MRSKRAGHFLLLALLLATAAAGETPAYLPRSAWVGSYFNRAVTVQVHVQWEFALKEDEARAFVLLLGGGGGYGLWLPTELGPNGTSAMTALYQHSLRAGAGFRSELSTGLDWGFQLAGGPLFYGSRFTDLPRERGVLGFLEARGQLGRRLGSSIYGLTAGYVWLFQRSDGGNTVPFLGGWMIGLFADRR